MLSILSVLVISGCAVGNKHNYSDSSPNIKGTQGNKLDLGVQDQRVYVLSGDKPQTFVAYPAGALATHLM